MKIHVPVAITPEAIEGPSEVLQEHIAGGGWQPIFVLSETRRFGGFKRIPPFDRKMMGDWWENDGKMEKSKENDGKSNGKMENS